MKRIARTQISWWMTKVDLKQWKSIYAEQTTRRVIASITVGNVSICNLRVSINSTVDFTNTWINSEFLLFNNIDFPLINNNKIAFDACTKVLEQFIAL